MPSPMAHCKQSVELLIVPLFLLGCVVPSSVGSSVETRRQSKEHNDLSKHSTAKKKRKKEKSRLGYVPLLLPLLRLLLSATPRTRVFSITDAPFNHESTVHL